MSDVMMFGIAQMPYEMAMDDEISRRQFYANTQRLVAALEAAREDAGRYRWLRAQNVIAVTSHDQSVEYQRDDLDAAIDQARGKGVAG